MKSIILILALFLGFALSSQLLHVQVSAKSNIKDKFKVLSQTKDFIGCEETKKLLIDKECTTEGDQKGEICKDHQKKLEKLDCKDDCQTFFKKYNKEMINLSLSQAKFYKSKKDNDNKEKAMDEAKRLKKGEEAYINLSCAADVQGMGEDVNDALEPEKKEKK